MYITGTLNSYDMWIERRLGYSATGCRCQSDSCLWHFAVSKGVCCISCARSMIYLVVGVLTCVVVAFVCVVEAFTHTRGRIHAAWTQLGTCVCEFNVDFNFYFFKYIFVMNICSWAFDASKCIYDYSKICSIFWMSPILVTLTLTHVTLQCANLAAEFSKWGTKR